MVVRAVRGATCLGADDADEMRGAVVELVLAMLERNGLHTDDLISVLFTVMAKGLKVVAIRHPMPYGDLSAQKVQRFAELADLEKHDCTIEEMEEYEKEYQEECKE